jgi:hypothetical protein
MEGVIYKFECKNKEITNIYIGHTNNEIKRYTEHKSSYNGSGNNKNCKIYQFIKDNGGWDNWNFIILERFSFSKDIAFKKEKEWYDQLQPNLNDRSPNGRIVSSSEKAKLWRERSGNYVCHCGMSVSMSNKARHLKLHL